MMFSNGDGITRIVSARFSVGFSNSPRFQIKNNNQKWEKFLINLLKKMILIFLPKLSIRIAKKTKAFPKPSPRNDLINSSF
jgi:hypothetical protein